MASDFANHAADADAHRTAAEIFSAVLSQDGAGTGLDADRVDGVQASTLEESAEIDADIATHDGSGTAHADIRGLVSTNASNITGLSTEIDNDITAHDGDGNAHADIRGLVSTNATNITGLSTEIDNDIASHNSDGGAHPGIVAGLQAEIDSDVTAHNADSGAHPGIVAGLQAEIDSDVTAHDGSGSAHADIRGLITTISNQLMPVGTIVGWHKSLSGVPSLPGTWVECNGGTVNDAASPINNQAIPNLNNNDGGKFLRGGLSSGAMQDDQLQGHIHNVSTEQPDIYLGIYQPEPNQGWWAGQPSGQRGGLARWDQSGGGLQSIFRQVPHTHGVSGPANDGSNGTPRVGNETRATNMSVVWIMRIK